MFKWSKTAKDARRFDKIIGRGRKLYSEQVYAVQKPYDNQLDIKPVTVSARNIGCGKGAKLYSIVTRLTHQPSVG
jgi:hypothetical protein